MVGRNITPLKEGDLDRILPSRRRATETIHNAITNVSQAAEWEMGNVDKVYHRLHLLQPYDLEVRRVRLNNIFRLTNFRVRRVGIS